ncbi:DMT family transporter [Roseomonas eburnea]|uniref:DMT family transporter n=1 Tax=Neoroseomonas eburnea TaxID=1346889 RepID=A0A9X9XJI1_9PROT|nr:DMT family transporter [Neoroseomonas eburnea]MBR0683867.1 DMT family transporter [Neoroseomonas eburnea]
MTWLFNFAAGATLIGILTSFTLASRLAYGDSLAPQDLVAIRFATSGLLLLPFAITRRGWALLSAESLMLAAAGGIGFAIPAFAGLAIVPASHAGALLHGSLPVFTVAIGLAMGRSGTNLRRGIGVGLMAITLAVIVWDSVDNWGGRQLAGAGLILLASATWSGFGLLAARLKLDPVVTAATVSAWSAVVYLPFYLLFLESQLPRAGLEVVVTQVAVQGVMVGTVSVFVYSWVVLRLGAVGAAVCTALVPSATALTALPLLSEHPTTTLAFALVLLAAGSLLSLTGANPDSRPVPDPRP